MVREKEVSTRLIRPVLPHVDVDNLMLFVDRWDPAWELDASVKLFDEGLAQYTLATAESHYKFWAALILGKPSLRCSFVDQEPQDELEEAGNLFNMIFGSKLSAEDENRLEILRQTLSKRGYRFD